MKGVCRPGELWPMYRQITAMPLWATDKFGVWGPKRKIAYEPFPDDEPPEPALKS